MKKYTMTNFVPVDGSRNTLLVKLPAFTLAEVLITLAIIGVVAAMTIPTLVANYQERAWGTSAEVFNRKLTEAMRVMNVNQSIAGLGNTENFVEELSKNIKITKICDNDNLQDCFSKTVYWGVGDADLEEVDMTTVKTAKHFGLDWSTNLVGVQFANGTTGLVAYNPDCTANPYSNQFNGTNCASILFDTSGFKTPNSNGKDISNFGIINSLGSACSVEVNGKCFGMPFYPSPYNWNACTTNGTSSDAQDLEFMTKYNITNCLNPELGTADAWAGAIDACNGRDNLPDANDLAALANLLYGTTDIGADTEWYCPSGSCKSDATSLGFKNATAASSFWVWSEEEYDSYFAYSRYFYAESSFYAKGYSRSNTSIFALCLVK